MPQNPEKQSGEASPENYEQNLNNQRREETRKKGTHSKNLFQETEEAMGRAEHGSKSRIVLEGSKLGFKLRKAAKEHQQAPWIIIFAMAIALDLGDSVQILWPFLLFFRIVLFVFMWGRGKWKVKLVVYTLMFLDILPIINIIPMTTAGVLYAYYKSEKKFRKANQKMEEHQKKNK